MLRSALKTEEQIGIAFKPTAYRTESNRYRLLCNLCGEIYFVDGETFRLASSAIERGFDNPFCCEDCRDGLNVWNFAE